MCLCVPLRGYLPEPANAEALDPFVVLDDILYIFRFTLAGELLYKTRFLPTFRKVCQGVPPMEKLRFVFIMPPASTARISVAQTPPIFSDGGYSTLEIATTRELAAICFLDQMM